VELAARLRATPETRDLLLVAVTGYGQIADQRRTAQVGFDAHLVKPVDTERLAAVLAQAPRRSAVDSNEDGEEVQRMFAAPVHEPPPARRTGP
jgi:CheY-like chemotaxis protein